MEGMRLEEDDNDVRVVGAAYGGAPSPPSRSRPAAPPRPTRLPEKGKEKNVGEGEGGGQYSSRIIKYDYEEGYDYDFGGKKTQHCAHCCKAQARRGQESTVGVGR